MAIDLVKDSRDVEIAQLKQELEEIKSRPIEAEPSPQGPSFEAQKSEDRDAVQIELDTAEEFIINSMFPNGIRVSPFVKTYLTMKGKTEVEFINESLIKFEKAIRPFMTPDGNIVLTGKPSELIRLAGPLFAKFGQMIGG